MEKEKAIAGMKKWCLDHYEDGADTMVECWGDGTWAEFYDEYDGNIGRMFHILEAMAGIYRDRQADADHYANLALEAYTKAAVEREENDHGKVR
jgi:hypothetical protein